MKSFLLLIIFFVFSLTINGQDLKFYDNTGSLIANNDYKIDIEDIEIFQLIEQEVIDKILPTLIYPIVPLENGITGKGIINIKKEKGLVSINLIRGADPDLDQEALRKISKIKEFLSNDSIFSDFEFYIPYHFKFGDESDRDSFSLDIIYPGNRAEMYINKDGLKLYVFENKYEISEEEIIFVDNILLEKFDEYIKTRNGGMIGNSLVDKIDYQKFLIEEKNRLFPFYNRVIKTEYNIKGEKILKIVFTKNGLHGKDVIEYNLEKNEIVKFYETVTY